MASPITQPGSKSESLTSSTVTKPDDQKLDEKSLSSSSSAGAPDSKADANPSLEQTSNVSDPAVSSPKADVKPVADEKTGSKFAALARKERHIQSLQEANKAEAAKLLAAKSAQELEIKAEKAKLEAERASVSSEREELNKFQSMKKLSALEAMKMLGFSYEQITEEQLNDGKPTPERVIEAKTKELESKFEARLKEQEDRAAQKAKEAEEAKAKALEDEKVKAEADRKQSIEKFHVEVADFVKENQNDYELINTNYEPAEAAGIIYATINQRYQDSYKESQADPKKKPVVLTMKEASDLFEQHLERQVQRNLATNKLKAKVSPPSAPKEEPKVTESSSKTTNATSSSKTLNNGMTASSVSTPALSEDEKMKRALAAFAARA